MNPSIGAERNPGQRSVLGRWVRSSIGAKWVMAVTGILFFAWLVLHLIGNLAVFGGQENFNAYANFLHEQPLLLWGQRLGLIPIVVLHILAGIRLSQLNRQARPERYQGYRYREAGLASRLMLVSGLIVLAFLVFHLLHLTFGAIFPGEFAQSTGEGPRDVYSMVVAGFSRPWVVAAYVIPLALVALHLSHGIWSALQTMGLYGTRWTPFARQASVIIAVLLAMGFISIPVAILIGALN